MFRKKLSNSSLSVSAIGIGSQFWGAKQDINEAFKQLDFAIDNGKLGNVGNKIKKGEWIWSKSDHKNFISKIRSILSLNSGFIRFYITCDGLIVSPIPNNHWEFYGIDFDNQVNQLMKIAPLAARSIQKRLELSKDHNLNAHHLLFVLGHIDDLMGGKLPEPDEDDPRTKGVDEK